MSAIVLLATSKAGAPFLTVLRRITELPLGELRDALDEGRPFFRTVLFNNDHSEQAARLRAIAAEAEREHVGLRVFELDEDEELDLTKSAETEISVATLRNILDARDELSARMERSDHV
jgi:hypothetical protein